MTSLPDLTQEIPTLQTFWQRNPLTRWAAKRTNPHPTLTDFEDRRRARLLANLSLTLAIILTVAGGISIFTSIFFPDPSISLGVVGTVIIFVGALGFWLSYNRSLTPHYRIGAWLTILTIYVFIGALMVFPQYLAFSTSLAIAFAAPVVLATIFLNSAGTVRVFIYSLVIIIALLIYQAIPVVTFAFNIGVMLAVTLLVVLVALLREEDLAQVQRLRVLEAAEGERLRRELDLARKVQLAMLPKSLPELPNLELAAYSQPAFEASGDFYDVFPLSRGVNSNKIGIVVCDVAGKGVSSALVMSATRASLRTEAEKVDSPARVLRRVNEMLAESIPTGLFVTIFYGVYDPTTRELRYASAGHPHPYYWTGKELSELQSFGMPLGLVPESEYDDAVTTLAPGSSLLIYTDGLIEALNPRREMYGFEAVQSNVESHARQHLSAKELLKSTVTDLETFLAGEPPHDDVTMVAMRLSEAA